MADLGTVRQAMANQITDQTGLSALAEARGSIQPPVVVILPGQPYVVYGATMDGTFTVNFKALVMVSEAAPDEKVQRALDAYLGIGAGTTSDSIPAAIMADPSLGGAVHFCEPLSISSYGRVVYNGTTYFGARLDIQAGVI